MASWPLWNSVRFFPDFGVNSTLINLHVLGIYPIANLALRITHDLRNIQFRSFLDKCRLVPVLPNKTIRSSWVCYWLFFFGTCQLVFSLRFSGYSFLSRTISIPSEVSKNSVLKQWGTRYWCRCRFLNKIVFFLELIDFYPAFQLFRDDIL